MKTCLTLLFTAIFSLSSLSIYGQEKAWPIAKHYDENHISKIALPIGGIGTGTVSLSGRGSLVDWEIMNRPGKGFSTVMTGNDAPFFAIHINDGEMRFTKGLMGPLMDYEYEHMEGRPVDNHGIPRFERATFDAAYPFGSVNLANKKLPLIGSFICLECCISECLSISTKVKLSFPGHSCSSDTFIIYIMHP